MTFRVGHGYDVHRRALRAKGCSLTLGGVRFDDELGLIGHSDADVVAHAIIDAIASAAGLGDIGTMFPDNDPAFADADSVELLARCCEAAAAAGWQVVNADCTVICDTPRIAPHRAEMQRNLTRAAGGPVTLSGRSTEPSPITAKLWPAGARRRKIEAHAVALLRQTEPDSDG